MMPIAQAVADLVAAPRPILFLDTCKLLDIVRAPLRDLAATPPIRDTWPSGLPFDDRSRPV